MSKEIALEQILNGENVSYFLNTPKGRFVLNVENDGDYYGLDAEFIPMDESGYINADGDYLTFPRALIEVSRESTVPRVLIWRDPENEDYTNEITFDRPKIKPPQQSKDFNKGYITSLDLYGKMHSILQEKIGKIAYDLFFLLVQKSDENNNVKCEKNVLAHTWSYSVSDIEKALDLLSNRGFIEINESCNQTVYHINEHLVIRYKS